MSEPFGPGGNGDAGQEENPDPEEDSDWSQGAGRNIGNTEASSHQQCVDEQGEDPEDMSCESGANENGQIPCEAEPHAGVIDSVSSSVPEEEENGRRGESASAVLVEGDSFEQDEQMAAPESENLVIQQACIESDQQLLLSDDAAMSSTLQSEEASDSTSKSNESDVVDSEEIVCDNEMPNVFSGDVKVDTSNGVDAPEDDIRIEQDDLLPAGGGAALLSDVGGSSVPEESPAIESQRMNDTPLDVERDSQIPECDRKEEGGGDSHIRNDSQRGQCVAESVQENLSPEQNECRTMNSEMLDSYIPPKPTDFSSTSPPRPESSDGQSSQNVESSERDLNTGSPLDGRDDRPHASASSSPSPTPTPSPSHSNSKFEHSNVTSPQHKPSHNTAAGNVDNPPPTSVVLKCSDAPAPANSSSSVTLLSLSSPKIDRKPSPSSSPRAGSVASSDIATAAAAANSISTESSLSPPQAVNNHNPVAAIDANSISCKNSQNGSLSNSDKTFHSNSPHRGPGPAPTKSEHKNAASSTTFSSGGKRNEALPDSPEDYYQKQLALALSNDDDDELDDIMSELDAELLSRTSGLSPQRSKPGQNSPQSALRSMSGTSQGKNDRSVGKAANGLVGDAEYRQLQGHNRQMLEQLKIRDAEINKLCEERDSSRTELKKVQSECQEIRTRTSSSSSHNADDLYLPQIKALETTIAQQQKEIQATKDKLISHDTAAKRAVTTLQNELKIRVDQVTKQYEEAVKEKDSMVVMFATSESRVMESKKATEKAESRLRDAIREKEGLISTLKTAKVEKQKAVNSFEQKCSEVGDVRREMEKLKEALSSADYRIKWFQNKLKDELETHKETKGNLDKTTSKLKETKEETEIIRRECQAIVKTYQESEEIKSNSLDKELKIKDSQLKHQMQEWNDNAEIYQRTKKELESLKIQHKDAVLQMNSLKEQVHGLEVAVAEKDSTISQSNELLNKQKADITGIHSKLKEKQNLDDDFNRAQEMIKSLDKDVSELKISNRDLQKDMESCRERESKMLALQSELSRTNACLRSENTTLSNKSTNQTAEVERLKMEIQELETTVKHLTDSVEDEKKNNTQAIAKLKASLEENTKESSDFKQKWEDEIDSNKTLKRRHANNVKDLTRQLQQTKRRLEVMEGSRKDSSGSMGSRTNSNGSLNSMVDTNQSGGGAGTGHHHNAHSGSSGTSANSQEFPVITEQVEIDKQVLIERIVRLQKSHARKNEKLEFLGEHIQQLLEEIKKKTKIIQSYVMREEAGTLSSEDMDANKVEAHKEMQSLLSRKGGIMASMYSQHQQDGNMTLELSLQINKKLQAVLEDTLLKNITLKENLDTLGEEIARLSQVNRKLQLHLQDLENPKKH